MHLTIPGVGRHAPGASLEQVKARLGKSFDASQWREFPWDLIVEQVRGPMLDFKNIKVLMRALAAASRLGLRPVRATKVPARWILTLQESLASVAEICLTVLLTAFLVVPVFAFVVVMPSLALGPSPALPREITERILLWLIGSTVIAMAAALVAGFVASLVTWSRRPLYIAVRWLILVLARPVVLVCNLPFTLSFWEILSHRGSTVRALKWLLVTGVYGFIAGALIGEPGKVLGNVVAALLVIAGACATWIAGQLVSFVLGPTLKVLLDIFRYLGEPSYRQHLQDAFGALVTQVPVAPDATRSLTIYAHSLGTVIALDSLLNAHGWATRDSVILITFGSPLRRLFLRFFPGILFPSSLADLHALIRRRVGEFRWVNVYRPFDQIGGSLGLDSIGAGVDVNTAQWGLFKSAHVNYLADEKVWAAVNKALQTTPAMLAPASTSKDQATYSIPDTVPMPIGVRPFLAALRHLPWMIPVLIFPMIWLTHNSHGTHGRERETVRSRLAASGVVAPVTVVHWEIVEQTGDDIDYIDHFQFIYMPDRSHPANREISLNSSVLFERYSAMFDSRALRAAVRDNCELLRKPVLLEQEVHVACVSKAPIEIRYLPSDPEQFDIPSHPPRRPVWRWLLEWGQLTFVALACVVGLGLLAARLGEQWARLILGLPLN